MESKPSQLRPAPLVPQLPKKLKKIRPSTIRSKPSKKSEVQPHPIPQEEIFQSYLTSPQTNKTEAKSLPPQTVPKRRFYQSEPVQSVKKSMMPNLFNSNKDTKNNKTKRKFSQPTIERIPKKLKREPSSSSSSQQQQFHHHQSAALVAHHHLQQQQQFSHHHLSSTLPAILPFNPNTAHHQMQSEYLTASTSPYAHTQQRFHHQPSSSGNVSSSRRIQQTHQLQRQNFSTSLLPSKRSLPIETNSLPAPKRKKANPNNSEVIDFLRDRLDNSEQMEKHINMLSEHPIQLLMNLTPEVLSYLGVTQIGIRKRLMKALCQYFKENKDSISRDPYKDAPPPEHRSPEVNIGHSPVSGIDCKVRFDNTKEASEIYAETTEMGQEQIRKLIQYIEETRENWVSDANSYWLQELILELSPKDLNDLQADMDFEIKQNDFNTKWEIRSRFTQQMILYKWFHGKTLEEVIEKAEKYGHTKFQGGFPLKGPGFQFLSKKKDFGIEGLHKICRQFSEVTDFTEKTSITALVDDPYGRTFGDTVHAYTISKENLFQLEFSDQREVKKIIYEKRTGSLNTTIDMTESILTADKNVDEDADLLPDYYRNCHKLFGPLDDIARINPRFYFIWKFPGYATGHHQDIHVSPHCTVYNQLSGASYFHFLPLMLGLYITYLGSTFGADIVAHTLRELDKRGIGKKTLVEAGDLVFITAFGSHGVFVPDIDLNPTHDFMVSSIRACEVYLRQSENFYAQELSKKPWYEIKGLLRPTIKNPRRSDKPTLNLSDSN